MKKIITLLTTLALIFNLFSIGFAAEAVLKATEFDTVASSFLEELGIISTSTDGQTDIVSRENFALYLARAMRYDEYSGGDVRYFTDVAENGYSVAAINFLVRNGIISESEDKTFRPTDNITVHEACKLVVSALGYGKIAEADGGYPYGYLKVARALDIIPAALNGKGMTVGEAEILLYEALQVNTCEPSKITVSDDIYTEEFTSIDTPTMLELYWDIYTSIGTVEAVYGGRITDGAEIENNSLVLGGVAYKTDEESDYLEYLGSYVKLFFEKKTSDAEPKAVFIDASECKTEDAVISFENFISYETAGNTVIYYKDADGTKISKKELTTPKILYNYFPIRDDLSEMFNSLNKGSIILKDSNNDGVYDIISIIDYKNFIVNYADAKNMVWYNKLSSDSNIPYGDMMSLIVYNSAGERTSKDEITANVCLAVARPWDNAYNSAVLYISNSIMSGKIESVSDTDKMKISIDGKEYNADKSYSLVIKDSYYSGGSCVLLGADVNFMLDCFGNIAYITTDNIGNGTLALILGAISDGIFDSKISVKLYNENNELSVLECSDNVQLDGIRYRRQQSGLIDKINSAVYPYLVLYRTDADGKINFIDTAKVESGLENEENSLSPVFDDTNKQRFYNSGRLQMKTVLNEKTKVFCVPRGGTQLTEDNLYVDSQSKFFISDRLYYADAYYKSTNNAFADAVVYYYESDNLPMNYAANNSICIVESTAEGMDAEGNLVGLIHGYDGTKQVSYTIPSDVNIKNLKKGDMIYITFDIKGNPVSKADLGREPIKVILNVDKLYDETGDKTPGWTNNQYHTNYYELGSADSDYYRTTALQLVFGYIHKKLDTNVFIGYNDGSSYDEAAVLTGNVLIYDRSLPEEQRLYLGTIADVVDFRSAGEDCSRIVYATRAAAYRFAVVFK